jgi:hypothetical protein
MLCKYQSYNENTLPSETPGNNAWLVYYTKIPRSTICSNERK